MKTNNKNRAVSFYIITIIFIVSSCIYSQNKNFERNEKNEINSSEGKSKDITSTIVLSREEMEKSGIVSERLKETKHKAALISYGSVVSIKDLSNDVQSYETAKAQLAKAKQDLSVSQKNYDRLKSLYDKKLASEQDFQNSQALYLSDKANVNSAQANLTGIKSEINEQWGNEISKIILNDSVKLQNLLSLKETLLQISLPPGDAGLPTGQAGIKIPDRISVLSPLNNNKKIVCRFLSAGHIVSLQFQTKTLYYVTSNTTLSSGMNVKALIPVGKELTGVIVPSSSIVWYQGKACAYVESSGNKFYRVEIDMDNPAGTGFFVPLNNRILTPGNYIVTEGAQLLLSKEIMPSQKTSAGDEDND